MTAIPPGWTPEQARKRLEAATPGEWDCSTDGVVAIMGADGPEALIGSFERWADADLVANAPQDIAALLALLDEARETLEQLVTFVRIGFLVTVNGERATPDVVKNPEARELLFSILQAEDSAAARAFLARLAAPEDEA